MKYIYLNEKFYNDFPKDLYPELEIKKERPYVQIVIEINNVMFAFGKTYDDEDYLNSQNKVWANNTNLTLRTAQVITAILFSRWSNLKYTKTKVHVTYINDLKASKNKITGFDERLFYTLVNKVIVNKDNVRKIWNMRLTGKIGSLLLQK